MNRTKKNEVIDTLAQRLTESPNLYLTDFTGIAVKPMTELRRRLRDAGSDYVVVKNTLALRAFTAASVDGLEDILRGPTGVVFAGADPLVIAKVITEFRREHEKLEIKVGLVEGRRVTAEEVARLAALPPRDELLGQLGGALQAPLQGFVGALNGMLTQLVGALEALRGQRATA
jgi:large subunit ribosomal protein L10